MKEFALGAEGHVPTHPKKPADQQPPHRKPQRDNHLRRRAGVIVSFSCVACTSPTRALKALQEHGGRTLFGQLVRRSEQ
jgi:hypothetical protein